MEARALFEDLLRKAVELKATDIHLKTGLPPIVRRDDELKLMSRKLPALTAQQISEICMAVAPAHLHAALRAGREADMGYGIEGVGRFRLNVFMHRGQPAIICRYIPFEIRALDSLGLPAAVKGAALQQQGLVLVTGPAGSGKSTTLAAMLNEWNQSRGGHIVTIEDPVEYLIRDKRAVITQREVGVDTENFASGLRNALRQDPDVIMIGEIRDAETLRTAMMAAETGHMVLSTLHSKDAAETVNRIVGIFEPEQQQGVRVQFAATLAAVVSQRLIPRVGGGLVLASEVLVNAGRVRDCLIDAGKAVQLREAIEQGAEHYGMQSMDQCLMRLLKQKLITRETALRHAAAPADFDLKLRGISSSDGNRWQEADPVTQAPVVEDGEIDLETLRKKAR